MSLASVGAVLGVPLVTGAAWVGAGIPAAGAAATGTGAGVATGVPANPNGAAAATTEAAAKGPAATPEVASETVAICSFSINSILGPVIPTAATGTAGIITGVAVATGLPAENSGTGRTGACGVAADAGSPVVGDFTGNRRGIGGRPMVVFAS